MSGKMYATCVWPGLTDLWWRGRLSALPYALAFGFVLNLYLVAQFVYPEWLPKSVNQLIFWVGLPIWLLFIFRDIKLLPSTVDDEQPLSTADLFNDALAHTLRNQYAEAEGVLTDMLAIEPRDPPALLLLAGLYRTTNRYDAAKLLLREMQRLEVADRWWLEIQAEERRYCCSSRRQTGIRKNCFLAGDVTTEDAPSPHPPQLSVRTL